MAGNEAVRVRPSEIAKMILMDSNAIKNWRELVDRFELSEHIVVQLTQDYKNGDIKTVINSMMDLLISEKGEQPLSLIIADLEELKFTFVKDMLQEKYGRQNVIISKGATRAMPKLDARPFTEAPTQNEQNPAPVAAISASSIPVKQGPDEIDFVHNMVPLEVKVKKSSIEFIPEDAEVYKIQPKAKRYALIINNTEFEDETLNREGGEQDGKYMKELFDKLHYDCQSWSNVASTELDGIIKNFKARLNKKSGKADSCVVVVMTHGERDQVIMADDKPVNMWDKIVYQFNDTDQDVKGIPKMFIFQACQNFRTTSDAVGTGSPQISDAIVCFATIPGTPAQRDIYLGSWFIYCITKVFMENAHDKHFEELLKMVQVQMTKILNGENLAQVCTWQSFLFKKFYFNP